MAIVDMFRSEPKPLTDNSLNAPSVTCKWLFGNDTDCCKIIKVSLNTIQKQKINSQADNRS